MTQTADYKAFAKEFRAASTTDEGSATNGREVGSGYDCTVRRAPRSGEFVAQVYDVAGKAYGYIGGFITDSDDDERGRTDDAAQLHRVAREIANCPSDVIWE